jgi:hypothetical protein
VNRLDLFLKLKILKGLEHLRLNRVNNFSWEWGGS